MNDVKINKRLLIGWLGRGLVFYIIGLIFLTLTSILKG
jgi:hypothetical protein